MDRVLKKQSQQKHFLQDQTGLKHSSILAAQGKLDLIPNEVKKEQVPLESKTSRVCIDVETEDQHRVTYGLIDCEAAA